jgi:hypothetical protein
VKTDKVLEGEELKEILARPLRDKKTKKKGKTDSEADPPEA